MNEWKPRKKLCLCRWFSSFTLPFPLPSPGWWVSPWAPRANMAPLRNSFEAPAVCRPVFGQFRLGSVAARSSSLYGSSSEVEGTSWNMCNQQPNDAHLISYNLIISWNWTSKAIASWHLKVDRIQKYTGRVPTTPWFQPFTSRHCPPWKDARRSSTSWGTQCPCTGIFGVSLLFKVTSSCSGSLTQETERLQPPHRARCSQLQGGSKIVPQRTPSWTHYISRQRLSVVSWVLKYYWPILIHIIYPMA